MEISRSVAWPLAHGADAGEGTIQQFNFNYICELEQKVANWQLAYINPGSHGLLSL